MFWGLKDLDLPDNLPVKDKQHIADHSKHEDLNTHDNQEHSKNGKRDVFDIVQPFDYYIDTNE